MAPPGAGKSTVVPLALLDRSWVDGKRILMLAPRRLAARAAAARMAATLGEAPGQTVGYRVRMETRVGPATRIEVLTEGVFVRRILGDPELADVACVIFDEFHERSLDADLGLALALDVRSALRPDLRILPMSATLDDARLAALLGDAPIVRSEGLTFPVETRYLGRPGARRLEDAVAEAVRRALREETGGVLVFLPGRGEIERVGERLGDLGPSVDVLALHGGLEPKAQDAALRPPSTGRRKVVLATAIAETSLTLPDIRVVVDAGLARVPRFDPAVGLTRLQTERATLSAVDQRRGRAGRVEPGVCYRLWDEAETRSLTPFPRPEMLEADLGPLALALADWGAIDPSALAWLDPPPAGPLRAAADDLGEIGALHDGRLTDHGRALLRVPAPPRLAHMAVRAAAAGEGKTAAMTAVLVMERGLGGGGPDLRDRMTRLLRQKGGRAAAAKRLAERMTGSGGGDGRVDPDRAGAMLALAWPERVAKALPAPGRFQMANGRQAFLEETDPLARAEWLVVADATGRAAEARILAAAPIASEDVEAAAGDLIVERRKVSFHRQTGSVRVRLERWLGRILLAAAPAAPTADEAVGCLMAAVEAEGLALLPMSDATTAWLARARAAGIGEPEWPDLSDAGLSASLGEWLASALGGARAFDDIDPGAVLQALKGLLDWRQGRWVEAAAPETLPLGNGRKLRVAYGGPNGPTAAAVIQDLFGVTEHPTVAGVPVLLELLSPARRPAQTTRDLPGFWAGSYAAVRAELRGRYPKHSWPDAPASAAPPARRR